LGTRVTQASPFAKPIKLTNFTEDTTRKVMTAPIVIKSMKEGYGLDAKIAGN